MRYTAKYGAMFFYFIVRSFFFFGWFGVGVCLLFEFIAMNPSSFSRILDIVRC